MKVRRAIVSVSDKTGVVQFARGLERLSIEKAFKALYLLKLKQVPRGHSIIYFAQKLQVPEYMLSGIRDLNPEYLTTRYPDMAVGIPAEI